MKKMMSGVVNSSSMQSLKEGKCSDMGHSSEEAMRMETAGLCGSSGAKSKALHKMDLSAGKHGKGKAIRRK